jgi:hypothetical protein
VSVIANGSIWTLNLINNNNRAGPGYSCNRKTSGGWSLYQLGQKDPLCQVPEDLTPPEQIYIVAFLVIRDNSPKTRDPRRPNHYSMVPGHQCILVNEKADQAAKEAAVKTSRALDRSLSLAYICRACTEASRKPGTETTAVYKTPRKSSF